MIAQQQLEHENCPQRYWAFLLEFVWFIFWWCPLLSVDSFHKLYLLGTCSENMRVEILGIGWLGVVGLTPNESVPWEVMPEVFKCFTREMRWRLISRTEQNTWIPQAKLPMGQTHFTSNRYPWPSYSQDLNQLDYFLRGYLKHRVCENKPQTREDIIRREIRLIPQEMHNKIVNNFNVRAASVLSYSSTVHRTNIALITEKV